LNVLGIWREGKPLLADFAALPLHFGDALLVQGPAAKIHGLNRESEFMLLQEDPDAVLKPRKQRLAFLITFLTLGIASLGFLPVAVVVLAGAVLLLLTRCLDMSEAYHSIEWKAIFLIAGMWPLSIAIRSTGLAEAAIQALQGAWGQISPLALAAILILIALAADPVHERPGCIPGAGAGSDCGCKRHWDRSARFLRWRWRWVVRWHFQHLSATR